MIILIIIHKLLNPALLNPPFVDSRQEAAPEAGRGVWAPLADPRQKGSRVVGPPILQYAML